MRLVLGLLLPVAQGTLPPARRIVAQPTTHAGGGDIPRSRTLRPPIRILPATVCALAATTAAQQLGPIGLGPDLGGGVALIAGRFEPWDRVATPA